MLAIGLAGGLGGLGFAGVLASSLDMSWLPRSQSTGVPPVATAPALDADLASNVVSDPVGAATLGPLLARRTAALEQFADRCAVELWTEAESLRDAAGRAELSGNADEAISLYQEAGDRYDSARDESSVLRAQSACLDHEQYIEIPPPPPIPPDPPGMTAEEAAIDAQVRTTARVSRNGLGGQGSSGMPVTRQTPLLSPEQEGDLRSDAVAIAGRGEPCRAARMLKDRGSEPRTLSLASELQTRCFEAYPSRGERREARRERRGRREYIDVDPRTRERVR